MNNSFIFTPPAAQSAPRDASPNFQSPPRTSAPALPFSNVLERAVQTPPRPNAPRPKHDSLTGGRSAEHRAARSIEAHDEHKPSARSESVRGKRKDRQDEDVAIQPATCAGMSTPAMPVLAVPAHVMTEGKTEAAITVADCSDAATPTNETGNATASAGANVGAKAVLAAGMDAATDSAAETAPANMNGVKRPDGDDGAVEKSFIAELKPVEPAVTQGALTPVKNLPGQVELPTNADQKPTASSEEFSLPGETTERTWVAPPSQSTQMERPRIPASNAREVALGVSREEAALDTAGEILQATAPTEVTVVEVTAANEIAPEELRRTVRAIRRSWDEMHENTSGTAAAKMTMSMNNEAKKEEIAGLTQQLLPGGAVAQSAHGINLPSESVRHASSEIINVDALSAAARLSTGPARTDVSVNGELVDVRDASPTARLGEVISREVRMFKRGGDDLVEVVLTPDAKTQISLKLQWRDGQVEVQARCDMGDHRLLNTQWPELQASFAAHGVRLSHLSERVQTGFTEFFNNSGFSKQQGGEHQSPAQRSAADAPTPAIAQPAKPGAAKSAIRTNHRLESWA